MIREASASETQLQGRRTAGPVCSTKTEAARLGLVHSLFTPISYASCFASFIRAPHLGIAGMPQRSATPTVAAQFTKDTGR